MKKIIFCFILILCASKSYAQFIFSAGPYITAKAGIDLSDKPYNSDFYNSYGDSDIGIGLTFDVPDLGASMMLNLTDLKMAFICDIGYSSTSALSKYGENASDDDIYVSRINYFNIAPSLSYEGIFYGFNLAFPISGNVSNKSGSKNINTEDDEMNTMIEMRVGGMIPIMKSETGVLNIVITGNFQTLKRFYSDSHYSNPKYELLQYPNLTNPRVYSLSIGVNYLFTISDQQ